MNIMNIMNILDALIPYTFFIALGIIMVISFVYLAVVKYNEKKGKYTSS
jgi:hypothetical protein